MRPTERGPDGNKQAADENPISYTPGAAEDKETASARANRTDQADTTGLAPERAQLRRESADPPGEHGDARQAQQPPAEDLSRQPPLDSSADPLR